MTTSNKLAQPLIALLFAMAVVLGASSARAGAAGREVGVVATSVHVMGYTLEPNTGYFIDTTGLSPGTADTVLHVQSYPDGEYVAGNDDCALPGYGFESCVSIGSAAYVRIVWIVVRSRTLQTGGTGTLRIIPSQGRIPLIPITFFSGASRTFPSIPTGMHLMTAEEPRGADNTVMLVTSGTYANAIAFDDLDGVGDMAAIHMSQTCTSDCKVIIATPTGTSTIGTTFVWDEDADVLDTDQDGLSNTLETEIGTMIALNDTDGDGIQDGEELLGIDVGSNLLRMPRYGADPLERDAFVEADWRHCVPIDPSDIITCGLSQDPDLHRMVELEAVTVGALYYAPDVRVHIDTGVDNTEVAPADWTRYGNWAGATRSTFVTGDKCETLSADRVGYFHGGRINFVGNGDSPGRCFDADNTARHYSHELGHNFYLGHGAHPLHGAQMNCKPNYPSIMSYAFMSNLAPAGTAFSRNQSGVSLNPTGANEAAGLDPATLDYLDDPAFAFRYKVNLGSGAVDWNRDGDVGSGTVRAAVTWGWGGGGGCEHSFYGANHSVSQDRRSTALSRFRWPFPWGSRLYWFTRRESDGRIEYRYATSFPSQCQLPAPSDNCTSNWYPTVSSSAELLTTSLGGEGAPAAAWFTDYAGSLPVHRLVLVYKDTANHLRYQLMHATFNGIGYVESWTAPAYVGTGTEVIIGDPALVSIGGTVWLLASTGTLQAWSLSSGLGGWSGPAQQVWNDTGYPIVPKFGVALTRGYVRYASVAAESFVAAIPLASPSGQVELAFRVKPLYGGGWTDAWNRLPASSWTKGQPVTVATPGLAYEPFDKESDLGDITDGRYYLAWNVARVNPDCGWAGTHMTQTEGGWLDGSTVRRLVFDQDPVWMGNEWLCGLGNVSLSYDLELDSNVRGAVTVENLTADTRSLFFFPFADGIYNATLNDQDDYLYIKSNLMCSIKSPWTCQ